MAAPDVLIIGAGLAGLTCARTLQRRGVSFLLLDAADGIGGRVRTDVVDGFRLDRGFQVLLTAYPEAQAQLDYSKLGLRAFEPGAIVRAGGRFIEVADPFRKPWAAFGTLRARIGSLGDKFRIASLRSELRRATVEEIFSWESVSTLTRLRARGFSPRIIERFFQPFYGGVFLDPQLGVSSRMFEFTFKMFSEGDAAVPERGMQSVPEQLAEDFPEGSVRLGTRVDGLDGTEVRLEDGETLRAAAVVVATDGDSAGRLLPGVGTHVFRSATCLYFTAPEAPVRRPVLVLNGSGRGPINNLHVASAVAPSCAPRGKALISVTVLGIPSRSDESLATSVREQLQRWYGRAVDGWRLLRIYRITHALPVVSNPGRPAPARITAGVYVCGDHRSSPSIQGAMESGRLAAEALLADFFSGSR